MQTSSGAAKQAFPDAGWEIRDRSDAAPGMRRFVEQITMFLTLVGLTALAVGGVGAGQAIGAFLDRKRAEIAILKSLGADGGLVFLIFFLQVMAVAAARGCRWARAAGAAAIWRRRALRRRVCRRRRVSPSIPGRLLLAAAFGLLSAVAFAVPPLARAREIAPASLFRDIVAPVQSARVACPISRSAAAPPWS